MSLASETSRILKENDIRLSRKFGQNYLVDSSKRDKIIGFANLSGDDAVLEIGSGIGTMTLELARHAGKVISIEQDPRIFSILEGRLEDEGVDNVELICDDALNVDFPFFNKVVANLPYQISSPITFKFLEYDFDYGVLMYQKEFALRMNADFNTKSYSRLSATLYFKADVRVLDFVSPACFMPQPKVDSAVVCLKPYKDCVDVGVMYSRVCRALFQHKRKKVRNALVDSYHELGLESKDAARDLCNGLGDFVDRRVLSMSPEDILDLSRRI